ncbi:MAG: hypothetical protein Q4B63_11580 [Clostridium perfringens]|nr:hypothetical protein [Clostridium perfringens]
MLGKITWIDKLEKRFGKFCIKNLMYYITILTGFIYVLGLIDGGNIVSKLYLVPQLVMMGQIWRVISFIIVPPSTGILWIVFTLYLYYIIGSGLERAWGSFRFNVYYLLGMIVTIVVSFLTGMPAGAWYLNSSLFLAFAMVYPDVEFLIFFILPVKVKYLGYLSGALIAYEFITASSMGQRLLVIAPVISFFIFFGPYILSKGKKNMKTKSRKRRHASHLKVVRPRHICSVCGITDEDDPKMEFRYCSKCKDHRCYCINHIRNHTHVE